MDEILRVDFDWSRFDFDVASETLRNAAAHLLEQITTGQPIEYPEKLRTIRMVLSSNDRFQELTPYSLFGPHRYTWVDLLFLCECFVDQSQCESTFNRSWRMEHFPNLFGHLITLDRDASAEIASYTAQDVLDAFEKITWTITDHLIPKNDAYREELSIFFEVLCRRAKLFFVAPCSSKFVEPEYVCKLDEIHDDMLRVRSIKEEAIDVPYKDVIDVILDLNRQDERSVEVNMMFAHRVNLLSSWIEREIVESDLLTVYL